MLNSPRLRRSTSVPLACVALLSGCGYFRLDAQKPHVKVVADQTYVLGSPHSKHKLDLYLPRNRDAAPLVLFVHGGFWRNQDRRYYQAFTGLHGNIGTALAKQGFAVGVMSYRLFPEATLADQLADVARAAKWMTEHAAQGSGRASSLFLVGFSAGGHLVMSICADPLQLYRIGVAPGTLRGCASLSGVLDIAAMAAGQTDSFNHELTIPLFGATADAQARYSIVGKSLPERTPTFLLWAEKDYPFVKSAGQAVAPQLRAQGVQVSTTEVSGYEHADVVLQVLRDGDAVTLPLVTFLKEQIPP